MRAIGKKQKILLLLFMLFLLLAGWRVSKQQETDLSEARLPNSVGLHNEPSSSSNAFALKQAQLKPVKEAAPEDLIMLPFSGGFKNIEPQIDEYAACNAAALLASDKYRSALLVVDNELRKQLHAVLVSVDPAVNLYDFKVEYIRLWWTHKGYFEGLAKAAKMDITEVANIQARNCIEHHHPDGMDALTTSSHPPDNTDPWIGKYILSYTNILKHWTQNTAMISKATDDAYRLAVNIEGDVCSGDFEAIGKSDGKTMLFKHPDDEKCQLKVTPDPPTMTINIFENDGCSGQHGFECNFGGIYVSQERLSIEKQKVPDASKDTPQQKDSEKSKSTNK